MKGQRYWHITQTAVGEKKTGEQLSEVVSGIHLLIQQMFCRVPTGSVPAAGNMVVSKSGTVLTHMDLTLYWDNKQVNT